MIELLNPTPQTVAPGQGVVYSEEFQVNVPQNATEPEAPSLLLLKPGRYLVGFSGNVAIPAGGVVGEVSLAIALDGEPITGSVMRATPAAVSEYFNVATQHYIDVPCGCCQTVTVQNTGVAAVQVDNPNLTAVRVCG